MTPTRLIATIALPAALWIAAAAVSAGDAAHAGGPATAEVAQPAYAKQRNDAGEIIVDESNFTIAETDRYFVDHVKEHPVNTFRHSREMSSVDNQFVVRENRDVMYSHAVVDISEGATLINPEWDVFSVIQVIDENQYTIASIYPGEQRTFTPEDVALGHHLFLNMRTGVRSLDEAGFAESHRHQDAVRIDAGSSKPYQAKGFEKQSLDATRARLKARMAEADKPQFYFGTKSRSTTPRPAPTATAATPSTSTPPAGRTISTSSRAGPC